MFKSLLGQIYATIEEQEQQRRIQKTAVGILKNEATFMNGGWSDNISGVPEEADKDTFSITLDIENCGGCAPADVADRIKRILINHLYETDNSWKKRMDEAKAAEAEPRKRRPLVEHEIPEYHSEEMGKVIRDLEKIVSFVPTEKENLDNAYREADPYLTSQMDYDAESSGPHPNVTHYECLRDTMPYIIVANKQLVLSYRESLKQISPSG